MRIGVNLFDVVPGQGRGGGGETYVTELVKNLALIDQRNDYVLFVNEQNVDRFRVENPRFTYFIVPLDSRKKWTRALWEQCGLPIQARRLRIDVLHSPLNTSPVVRTTRSTVTIHDLGHFHYARHFPGADTFRMRFQRWVLRHGTAKSDRIIAVSGFTRSEIDKYLKVTGDRVNVVYEAAGESFSVRRREPSEPQLVLAVTSDSLHKNVPRLIRSLALVKQTDQHFRVVIVGSLREESTQQSVGRKALMAEAVEAGVSDVLDIRGFVSERELTDLYHRAAFLVFPTLYEGFGLPIVEAMAAGLPLVVSHAASLPEIGGDCVLYFDPLDVNDIAAKISRALRDPALMSRLSARGLEHVKQFDWKKTAEQTLRIYEDVASGT